MCTLGSVTGGVSADRRTESGRPPMKARTVEFVGGDGGDASISLTCVYPPATHRPATRAHHASDVLRLCKVCVARSCLWPVRTR